MTAAETTPPLDPNAEHSRQLSRRLRISITLCVAPIILYALFDLALLRREALPVFWALKAAALLVIGISVALLRDRPGRPFSRRRLIAIALSCIAALYGLSTASAVLAGDAQATPLMTLAVTLATATLLPWGARVQLAVVAIGGLSTASAYYGADGHLRGLLQYPTMGLVIGMGVSVYVAGEFDRSRKALAERQRKQRRAEAEVRRLNEELEAQVAERTADLRRANRELRRSAEAARQRQAELTHIQRLATLGELAAGLAHEINQPLAAIVNYARGCARRLRPEPSSVAAVLPVIENIASEALRAGEVIRRLRQMIRKEPPRQEWVDFNALVDEAAQIVAPEAHDAGVRIEAYPAAGLPRVLGDGIQIEQVTLNLLRNAVEAMSAGGTRRILQLITRQSTPGHVELAVRDTGPGLPNGQGKAIFEPFFSTKPGGLGMGLSISRTIVEAHHGRLWAMSNPDGGMTFYIELPVRGAAGEGEGLADAAPVECDTAPEAHDQSALRSAR